MVLDPLKVELQAVMNSVLCVLGIELGPSGIARVLLTAHPS